MGEFFFGGGIFFGGGKVEKYRSNYREIRIIESILQGFLKDGDFTYVPIRERFGLERFGLERFNCKPLRIAQI